MSEIDKLKGELQDAVGCISIGLAVLKDPDDRIGLRDAWEEKALKIVGEYNERVRKQSTDVGSATRHQDWVGD